MTVSWLDPRATALVLVDLQRGAVEIPVVPEKRARYGELLLLRLPE